VRKGPSIIIGNSLSTDEVKARSCLRLQSEGGAPATGRAVHFVVLREPTERVSSLYDYIRTHPFGHKHREWLGRATMAELMRDPAARTIQFSNAQIRQLCGIEAAGNTGVKRRTGLPPSRPREHT